MIKTELILILMAMYPVQLFNAQLAGRNGNLTLDITKQPIKNVMTDIFFTSDCHFGHSKILEYESNTRKFSSVEEMDEQIIQNWNSVVNKSDDVYILGDLSFHKLNKTVEIMSRLNGKFCLCIGNHDSKFSGKQEFIDIFEGRVFDLIETKINKIFFVMCHYPMLTWNRSHYNSIQLFGHVHSKWKGNRQQLNVGMDCHSLFPVNIDQIPSLLENLPEKTYPFA